MTDQSDRPIAPVDLVFNGEFEIDSPVEATWPHVLNYTAWQNFPTAEHVSGPRGGEGEVVALKKVTEDFVIGPYFARTLKLDHEQHIVVWKVYVDPEQGGIEGLGGALGLQGNVEYRLHQTNDGRTRFQYNLIYEFLVPFSDETELASFRTQQLHDLNAVFEANWPKLKELAETGVSAHT